MALLVLMIPAIVIFFTLLFLAIFSSRFRGIAVAFLGLSLIAGFGFVAVASLISYRHAEARHRQLRRMQHDQVYDQIKFEESIRQHPQPAYFQHEHREHVHGHTGHTHEAVELTTTEVTDASVSLDSQVVQASAHVDTTADPPADSKTEEDNTAASPNVSVVEEVEAEDLEAEDVALATTVTRDSDAGDAEAAPADGLAEITESDPISASWSVVGRDHQLPEWVTSPPQSIDGHPAEVITSDPFVTRAECEDDVDLRIRKAVADFVRRSRRYVAGPTIPLSSIGGAEIQMVSRDQYVEMLDSSVGTMKQIHQLVVFDDDLANHIEEKAARVVVSRRLTQAGVASGGLMLLVASAFGLLKITTRPRKPRS